MLFRRSENRSNPAPGPSSAPGQPASTTASSGSTDLDRERTRSFIDASLRITGDLYSEGDVRLDGHICGNVTCAQLVVGKDAAIAGTVKAEEAIVRGTIKGTIRSPVVILQDTARVESEITYTLLAIDDGATFEGAAHRSDNPLNETETASQLVELQRLITVQGPSPTGAAASNGRDASSERGPDLSGIKPDRRGTNGRADTQK